VGAAGSPDWNSELLLRPALVGVWLTRLLTATYQVGVLGLVILGRAKQVLVDLEPERTGTIRTGVDH
jgi:hypothetical protein